MGKISNNEIANLKKVRKVLTKPLRTKWTTQLKVKQFTVELMSEDHKYHFKLYMRQAVLHENNFSCGISLIEDSENDITLARYNGSSHVHVNKLDGQRFDFQCHIHEANADCLKVARKIEDYAIATERYKDLSGAIQCILEDYNIININLGQLISQGGLFDEL